MRTQAPQKLFGEAQVWDHKMRLTRIGVGRQTTSQAPMGEFPQRCPMNDAVWSENLNNVFFVWYWCGPAHIVLIGTKAPPKHLFYTRSFESVFSESKKEKRSLYMAFDMTNSHLPLHAIFILYHSFYITMKREKWIVNNTRVMILKDWPMTPLC